MKTAMLGNLHSRLLFGRYEELTLSDVLDLNPTYIDWCMEHVAKFYISDATMLDIKRLYPDFFISAQFESLRKRKAVTIMELWSFHDGFSESMNIKLWSYDNYNVRYDWERIYHRSYREPEDMYCCENYETDQYDVMEDERTFNRHAGSWAQEVEGYSDEDIDAILDGDPLAYWNID